MDECLNLKPIRIPRPQIYTHLDLALMDKSQKVRTTLDLALMDKSQKVRTTEAS